MPGSVGRRSSNVLFKDDVVLDNAYTKTRGLSSEGPISEGRCIGVRHIYGIIKYNIPREHPNPLFGISRSQVGAEMDQKLSGLMLAVLMVLSATVVTVGPVGVASAALEDGFEYVLINGGAEVQITKYNGLGGAVEIPSEIDGKPVTALLLNVFNGNAALTSVDIPASVNVIWDNAFDGCTALTAINVAAGNMVYESEGGVLYSKGMTVLLKYPLARAGASFEVPGSVSTIHADAFRGASLVSISMGSGVITIGVNAFSFCTALVSVTLGSGVDTLPRAAFGSNPSLDNIFVDDGNEKYVDIDGVLHIRGSGGTLTLWMCPSGKIGAYDISPNVRTISSTAFSDSDLSSITIPEGVVTIEDYAFYGCNALTSIVIPNSVTHLGEGAFYECTALTSVIVGSGVPSLYYTFYGCSSLIAMVFEGNAPSLLDDYVEFYGTSPDLKVFCHDGATGFGATYGGAPTTMLGVGATAPNGLTATVDGTSVVLNWSAPVYTGGADITHYVISQNGAPIATVSADGPPTYAVTDLAYGSIYTFSVTACNEYSNGQGATVSVRLFGLTITSPADGSRVKTNDVVVHWGVEAAGELAYQVSRDGVYLGEMPTTSYAFNDLPDGTYRVQVWVRDNDYHFGTDTVSFTVDTVAPTVTARSPEGAEVAVGGTIGVTFDEAMNQTSVVMTLNGEEVELAWNGNTATYTPNPALAYGTAYAISVTGKDVAGNPLGTTSWTFTTVDGAVISGVVTDDATGLPIAGATISFGGQIDTTDENGAFTISGVAPGTYAMAVSKDGYAPWEQNVQATSGANIVNPELHDTAPPSVSIISPGPGTVFAISSVTVTWASSSDVTAVRISTDGENWTPITGTSNTSSYPDGLNTVYINVTDAAGNWAVDTISFTVDDIAPTVTDRCPVEDDVWIEDVISVTFSEAMSQNSVNIVVSNGATSIPGVISWNGNTAIFTPDSALDYDTVYTVTVTGKDMAGNDLAEPDWQFTTLKDEGLIYGEITDHEYNPLPGVTVTLSNGMTTTTNETGYFEFDKVPSGDYTITMAKEGYVTISWYPLPSLPGGYSVFGASLEAEPGSIVGTVKDADGNPISGATVRLNSTVSTTTNATGYFEFDNVIVGTYSLNVTKEGYRPMEQSVTLAPGEDKTLDPMSLGAVETDDPTDPGDDDPSDTPGGDGTTDKDDVPGDNTLLYVGAGVAIAIAALLGVLLLRKK